MLIYIIIYSCLQELAASDLLSVLALEVEV